MSSLDVSFCESPPALVVTYGPVAAKVARALATKLTVQSVSMPELETLVAESRAKRTPLPDTVLLASTDHADEVTFALAALHQRASGVPFRFWPAFVAGDTAQLTKFDQSLDDAGAVLADGVLMLGGAPTQRDQALALAAWLQVKRLAPRSVLNDLPDASGRTCRYVALGCTQLAGPAAPRATDSMQADADPQATMAHFVSLIAGTFAAVGKAADQLPATESLRAAAVRLKDAAVAGVAAEILRADRALSQAISEFEANAPHELIEVARAHFAAEVEPAAAAVANDAFHAGELLAAAMETASPESLASGSAHEGHPETDDAGEAISRLVRAISKGGIAKIFGRGRVAALGEEAGQLADRVVASAIDAAVLLAQRAVPKIAEDELNSAMDSLALALRESGARSAEAAKGWWQSAIADQLVASNPWPSTSTGDVVHSWGGGLAAPRRYVIGSPAACAALVDVTDVLAVVDIRERVDAEAERAAVLVAQYGLPLAAFT